jgi:hypothetical protein
LLLHWGAKEEGTSRIKLSRDAHFLEKLNDVVGLYMKPPGKVRVLCIDEKRQKSSA